MPRRATLHNAFTKGVLDPALSERLDVPHYYNGLDSGLNIEVSPQGGFSRRPGTTLGNGVTAPARLRRRVNIIDVTSGMITAPNGGTIGNLIDQSTTSVFTTVTAIAAFPYVIFQVDFGSALDVCFVDLIDFKRSSGAANRNIEIQYWTGSAWAAFGASAATQAKDASTTARTRRWARAPGQSQSAQLWRAVVISSSGGTATVGELRFWTEQRRLSAVRGITFAKTADLVLECVLSDRNIDVFKNHQYITSIPVPVAADDVSELEIEQQQDTMFLYHEDIATQQIVRQQDNDEFDCRPITFTNVPLLDAGLAFNGSQYEIQEVRFPGLTNGTQFRLWVGDEFGPVVTYSGNLVTSFGTALTSAMWPGRQTTDLGESSPGVRVTQTGGALVHIPRIRATFVNSETLTAQTEIVQRGVAIGSAIFGDTNGWPRCGIYFSERHILGGFRSAPMSWGMSRFGQLFDFLDDAGAGTLTADFAIFGTLNAREVQTIHKIFNGLDLHLFTESSEWFLTNDVLDATQPVSIKMATNYGIKSDVPVAFSDSGTMIIQRGGRVLRDLTYSDIELTYKAEPLSLLAPHLLTGVVDLAQRPARTTSEGNHLYLLNSDGIVAHLSFMRAQEVVAMAPWDFGGVVRAIFSDVLYRTWMIVERTSVANGADLYLELLDDTHGLDGAVKYSGSPTVTVTGLSHFEGQPVWAWADQKIAGPFTVSGGQITLDIAASNITAGRFPPLRARLPRLREKLQNGYPWRTPGRIYEAELAVQDTGQISIAVNGGEFQDVPLAFADTVKLDVANEPARDATGLASDPTPDLDPNLPVLDRLFTGQLLVTNLSGFSRHPTVEISQIIPAPLHVKAIRCELVHSG